LRRGSYISPFLAVCRRICTYSCENERTRAPVDEAIVIDDIKKFIADK
jgi:NADPH-dependent glutamate synthase beta subunit-like oxidoreductase